MGDKIKAAIIIGEEDHGRRIKARSVEEKKGAGGDVSFWQAQCKAMCIALSS